MCPLIGSDFHDWSDYNGVAFSIVTRMRSQIFGFLGSVRIQNGKKKLESCCLLNLTISLY